MIPVTAENFVRVFPQRARDAFWKKVQWSLLEVFETSPELAQEYRLRVEAAPIDEQILAYHDDPLVIAADLAGVARISELHLKLYERAPRDAYTVDVIDITDGKEQPDHSGVVPSPRGRRAVDLVMTEALHDFRIEYNQALERGGRWEAFKLKLRYRLAILVVMCLHFGLFMSSAVFRLFQTLIR